MAEEQPQVLKSHDLSSLLPYLSEGFCKRCKGLLEARLRNLTVDSSGAISALSEASSHFHSADSLNLSSVDKTNSASSSSKSGQYKTYLSTSVQTPPPRLYGQGQGSTYSPGSVTSRPNAVVHTSPQPGLSSLSINENTSTEQSDLKKMSRVGRKKNFVHFEKIDGRNVNIVEGLELHTQVFDAAEQETIVKCVYNLQQMGRAGQLKERTYTEPRKWMRGKGRVTIQFGCCYNYAVDKHGNPPGIIRDEDVDPMPSLLKSMIKRLVKWHVLPPTCVPNSCIINIYDEGDCIPPHIDHHDFVRPFCTASFLTESNILFGTNLKVAGPGEFSGPFSIPLPLGSVLILKGNGADVAKHCVPGVPGKRISITFRKMDESKMPYNFSPDPELQGLRPLISNPSLHSSIQKMQPSTRVYHQEDSKAVGNTNNTSFRPGKDDFPPLGKDDFPPLGQSKVKVSRGISKT